MFIVVPAFSENELPDQSLLDYRERISKREFSVGASIDVYIVIDSRDSKQQLFQKELERDWTKSNAPLNEQQLEELKTIGTELNQIRDKIKSKFKLHYFTELDNPVDVKLPSMVQVPYPAIKLGNSKWESIDKRSLTNQTFPLKTIEFYFNDYYNNLFKIEQIKEYNEKVRKNIELRKQKANEILNKVRRKFPKYKFFSFSTKKTEARAMNEKGEWIKVYEYKKENDYFRNNYSKVWRVTGKLGHFTGDIPKQIIYFGNYDDLTARVKTKSEKIDVSDIDTSLPENEPPFVYKTPKLPWQKYKFSKEFKILVAVD